MGKIVSYTAEKPKYHEGKPNLVLSTTPVEYHAIRFTNGEGKESMCVVATFGIATDGLPAVFLAANAAEMSENLRALQPSLLSQVRDQLLTQGERTAGQAPAQINEQASKLLDDVVLSQEPADAPAEV